MCFRNAKNTLQIRISGINGLRALFRKSADAVWAKRNLGKIVPALLHCITGSGADDSRSAHDVAALAGKLLSDNGRSGIIFLCAPPSPFFLQLLKCEHSFLFFFADAKVKSIEQIATSCMLDLTKHANEPHLRELIRPLFQYFVEHSVWQQPWVFKIYRDIVEITQQDTTMSELIALLGTVPSLLGLGGAVLCGTQSSQKLFLLRSSTPCLLRCFPPCPLTLSLPFSQVFFPLPS